MISNLSSKESGCGCGGGTASAAPCSCGGAGCGSCIAQGIVRPRFFAGQLLTEDDLQLLSDYVGHKNRLHNRHLFGAGVVCGLEVTCDPCGDGKVIVHPGYAIDCCGNDLTLSCPTSVDLNALVRKIRSDDCVDPCPDPKKLQSKTEETKAEDHTKTPKPNFRYCLYVRYCEQPSDPVTPYSTGEECVQVGCEPTRIREGVTFELRCAEHHTARNPLIERLCLSLGDLDKLPRVFEAVGELSNQSEVFASSKSVQGSPRFLVPHLSKLKTAVTNVRKEVPANREVVVKNTPANPNVRVLSPLLLNRTKLMDLKQLSMLVGNFRNLSPRDQAEILAATQDPQAEEVITQSQAMVQKINTQLLLEAKRPFTIVRDFLLERLSQTSSITDCTLKRRVRELTLPRSDDPSDTEVGIAADAGKKLVSMFIDYLRESVCRVLNPACMPCEDSAVLLACLDWEECEVKKICNMERTYVLSPAAVRYWLPPLQVAGNVLEQLCCVPWQELPREDESEKPNVGELLKQELKRLIKDSMCGISDVRLEGALDYLDRIFRNGGNDDRRKDTLPGRSPQSVTEIPREDLSEELTEAEAEVETTTERVTVKTGAKKTGMKAGKKAAKKTASKSSEAATETTSTTEAAKPATSTTAATPAADTTTPAATPKGEEK